MFERLNQTLVTSGVSTGITQSVQLCLFFLLIGLVLVFIKMNSYERRIQTLEENLKKYITYEDYMESFNNMFAAAARGESVSPFIEPGIGGDEHLSKYNEVD